MSARGIVIVQARMGSRRLPGKVLRPFAGTTILELLIERMSAHRATLGDLHVATTQLAEDDAVAAVAAARGCHVHRGSVDDVLSRFTAIVLERRPAFVIRATADDPFMDGAVGAWLLERARAEGADLAFATDLARGVSPEVARADALLRLAESDPDAAEREHVTLGLRRRPEFRALLVAAGADPASAAADLSVDTLPQFDELSAVAAELLPRSGPLVPWQDVARRWSERRAAAGAEGGRP